MQYRKLTHQEVAEIMLDAQPISQHHDLIAQLDALIDDAGGPDVPSVWRDARRGLVQHLESRAARNVPDAGIPYENSVEGQAVRDTIPSLRDEFRNIKYGPH